MIFKSKNLTNTKSSNHAFFSRKNGKSKGIYKYLNCGLGSMEDKKIIYKNLQIVKKKIKGNFLFLTNQHHSNKIIEIHKMPSNPKKIRLGKADGIFTSLNNIAIGILTADCAPILLIDKNNRYICCIHAGWKGAFKDIVKKAIIKFKEKKILTKDIKVCIGPCISKKNYEVQNDFYKKFNENKNKYKNCFSFLKNKIFFNLRYFIICKLLESKIPKINISNINMDTFSNPSLFYSYRRSRLRRENDYGRNISLIIKYN